MLKQAIWEQKKTVIYTVAAGTISGLTAVALFAQSGFLISKAALMPPFYVILILAAFLKLFGVAKSTSKYAERLLSHRVTFHLMSRIRESYFDKLLKQTSLFQHHKSGDLLHRITSDVETLQHYFLRVVYPPLVTGVVFLATILFTVIFSWSIAVLLMLGYLLCALIIPYVFGRWANETTLAAKEALSSKTTEYLYGYETLQHFNMLTAKKEALLDTSAAYAKEQLRHERQLHLAQSINQFVALAIAAAVLLVGASATAEGTLQGVYLAMLLMITLTVFELATPLAMMPSYTAATAGAERRLHEVTAEVVGEQHVDTILPICFHNVTFHYPTALSPALRAVSLTVQPGEKIAITGKSGSGKTTLLQLLLKELPMQHGTLRLNDVSIHNIADDALFAQLSVQLQHNHFFIGTVRDNLRLAKSDATDADMQAALAEVHLPLQLDDLLQEKASNLSGGERQRLAYARVLLQNTPCLVLDEPFSSVDAQLRQQLTAQLCARSNTVIMITHDTDCLEGFDKVYGMELGILEKIR